MELCTTVFEYAWCGTTYSNDWFNECNNSICLELANKGYVKAALENEALMKGFNTIGGKVTNQGVAEALGYDYVEPALMIK